MMRYNMIRCDVMWCDVILYDIIVNLTKFIQTKSHPLGYPESVGKGYHRFATGQMISMVRTYFISTLTLFIQLSSLPTFLIPEHPFVRSSLHLSFPSVATFLYPPSLPLSHLHQFLPPISLYLFFSSVCVPQFSLPLFPLPVSFFSPSRFCPLQVVCCPCNHFSVL